MSLFSLVNILVIGSTESYRCLLDIFKYSKVAPAYLHNVSYSVSGTICNPSAPGTSPEDAKVKGKALSFIHGSQVTPFLFSVATL